MQPFLQGFLGELVKVSFVAPDPVKPAVPLQVQSTAPSTGGKPAPFPKTPGAIAPGQSWTKAIPTQKMESPMAPPQSSGYRPMPLQKFKPGADPVTPAAPKRGGGTKKPAATPAFVPWQTAKANTIRGISDANYNKQLAADQSKAGVQKQNAGTTTATRSPGRTSAQAPARQNVAPSSAPQATSVRELQGRQQAAASSPRKTQTTQSPKNNFFAQKRRQAQPQQYSVTDAGGNTKYDYTES